MSGRSLGRGWVGGERWGDVVDGVGVGWGGGGISVG